MCLGLQCTTSKIEKEAYPIGFEDMNNYFVLNTVNVDKELHLFINNQEEFSTYFGEAAVMGRNGQPTKVDFKTQYVVAILLPPTDRETSVSIYDVAMVDTTVVIKYRVKKGDRMSYTMQPFTMVALDKPVADSQFGFIFKRTK